MTCPNCKDAGCAVQAANRAECDAWDRLSADGGQANSEAYDAARLALEAAQSDCAHRAAYPKTDLSTRLDRIEAVLRAQGLL